MRSDVRNNIVKVASGPPARRLFLQSVGQHFHEVTCGTPRAKGCLFPARDAGDANLCVWIVPDVWEETLFSSSHGHLNVLFFVSERPRHAAATGRDIDHLEVRRQV